MRCSTCPVTSGPCVGESHPVFCAWGRSENAREREHVVMRSAMLAEHPMVTPPTTAVHHEPPTLLQKAASFAKAVGQHVAAGLPVADEETVLARLATCHGCEHFNATQSTCGLCGCLCNTKARWLEQHCPAGKW